LARYLVCTADDLSYILLQISLGGGAWAGRNMIQLFDATFHSTAGELELMMRISDNITRGERRAGSGNTHSPEIKEFFFSQLSFIFYLGL
jgi:hypothetical protein